MITYTKLGFGNLIHLTPENEIDELILDNFYELESQFGVGDVIIVDEDGSYDGIVTKEEIWTNWRENEETISYIEELTN